LEFSLTGPDDRTASTDDQGNTAFRVAEGRYEVRGGVPGEFARLAVFCAPAASPGVAFPITIVRGGVRGPEAPVGIGIDLGGGDDVVCDWYNTPEPGRRPAAGSSPEPRAPPAAGGSPSSAVIASHLEQTGDATIDVR